MKNRIICCFGSNFVHMPIAHQIVAIFTVLFVALSTTGIPHVEHLCRESAAEQVCCEDESEFSCCNETQPASQQCVSGMVLLDQGCCTDILDLHQADVEVASRVLITIGSNIPQSQETTVLFFNTGLNCRPQQCLLYMQHRSQRAPSNYRTPEVPLRI